MILSLNEEVLIDLALIISSAFLLGELLKLIAYTFTTKGDKNDGNA